MAEFYETNNCRITIEVLTSSCYVTHEGATLRDKMAVNTTWLYDFFDIFGATCRLWLPLSDISGTMPNDRETDVAAFCEELPPGEKEKSVIRWKIKATFLQTCSKFNYL